MDNMPVLRALSEMVRKIYYFCISFPDYIKISLGFDARGTTKSKIRTSVLAPSIQQARAAERELSFNNIKEWTFLAGKIAPQKNQVILDIGANIGYASLLFREVMPAADIYAFEPSPTNLTYLRTNLKETGVNVEAIGLGAQEMEANLSLPEYVLGAGEDTERNTGRFSIYGAQNENSENIKIMTLDSWWKSTNQTRKIAFIKIYA